MRGEASRAMTTLQADDSGAVSIPPDLLRKIGVQPNAQVSIEVSGTSLVVRPPQAPRPEVEVYPPQRNAEFQLNGALYEADYAAAVQAVRELGIDPDTIPHDRPVGV
jgi:hypothetical protein